MHGTILLRKTRNIMEKQEAIEKYKKLLSKADIDNMPKSDTRTASFHLCSGHILPMETPWSFRLNQIRGITKIYSFEFDYNNRLGQLTWDLTEDEYKELIELSLLHRHKVYSKVEEDKTKLAKEFLRNL